MRSDEALEWAADYAERTKIFAPVVNSRGYPDGWKPPTPSEKLAVIKELAAAVTDREPTIQEGQVRLCDHGYVICAPCGFVPDRWKVS